MPVPRGRFTIGVMPVRSAARLVLGIALLTPAATGLGCGQGERVGRGGTLHLALTEYRLNPRDVRVAQGRLTIAVRNFGRLTHSLIVSRGGQSIGSTKPIAPGQSAQLTLVLKRGTYLMASNIQSDQALGQYGTLSVTR